MYSRNISSKRSQPQDGAPFNVPPHYSGVRFRSSSRSDGRSEEFEQAVRENASDKEKRTAPPEAAPISGGECAPEIADEEVVCKTERSASPDDVPECPPEHSVSDKRFGGFLSGLKGDDILIIALILFLSGERGDENRSVLLLLVVLLCLG